jgi:hypothetical protein
LKKQYPQDVIQSTYISGIGGKILKWWGGGCSRGGAHFCMMIGGEWKGDEERYMNLLLE